jgi:hypothetical protein
MFGELSSYEAIEYEVFGSSRCARITHIHVLSQTRPIS